MFALWCCRGYTLNHEDLLPHIAFVLFNLFFIVMIIASGVKMANTVRMSSKMFHSDDSRKTTKDNTFLRLCMFLTILISTNLACWLPYITITLLVIFGVHLPDTVLGWMAILVVPINSLCNPFVYTLFKMSVLKFHKCDCFK